MCSYKEGSILLTVPKLYEELLCFKVSRVYLPIPYITIFVSRIFTFIKALPDYEHFISK